MKNAISISTPQSGVRKAKSTPGGQTLKKLVKVDQAAVIVIRNADGKLSLPRKLKRAS